MKPHWSVKPFLWLFAVVTVPLALAFKEKKNYIRLYIYREGNIVEKKNFHSHVSNFRPFCFEK